jgi:hypothetical protein
VHDKIRKWLYDFEKSNDLQKYTAVAADDINEKIKNKIFELEELGGILAKELQNQYEDKFEEQGKRNFSIWVSRDLNGDVTDSLTADSCLEKEYRSQIAIDYNDPGDDNDFYAATLTLWHYHRGYFKNFGTLYEAAENDLEKDIKETLKNLLN